MRRTCLCWGALLLLGSAGTLARAQSASAPAATTPTASAPGATPPTASAPAGAQRLVRVAVPNMVASGDTGDLAKTLTQVLTIEVTKVRGIQSIGMTDIEALLSHEQQKALAGCDDASCIAEIGGALGVDALLSSSVGRVGDTYVLSIRLNDTHTARQLGSAYETVPGKPDDLIRVVQRKVPEVLRAAQPAWAVESTAPQSQPVGPRQPGLHVRAGDEEKSLGFHVVWPAVGVAAAGGATLVVAGAIAAFGFMNFAQGAEYPSLQIGRNTFYAPWAHEAFLNGQRLAWAALIATLVGGTAIAGGTAWQVIGGFSDAEGSAP